MAHLLPGVFGGGDQPPQPAAAGPVEGELRGALRRYCVSPQVAAHALIITSLVLSFIMAAVNGNFVFFTLVGCGGIAEGWVAWKIYRQYQANQAQDEP